MQKPLLYTYRRCPHAMRARMMLIIAGIAFDAHEVSLRDKPPEVLAGAHQSAWLWQKISRPSTEEFSLACMSLLIGTVGIKEN